MPVRFESGDGAFHPMLKLPKLKSCFHAEPFGLENTFLLSEAEHRVLRGRLYGLVVPFLQGRHTVDEIINELEDRASAAEVLYALALMEKNGYLVESDDSLSVETEAFWHSLDVNSQTVLQRLREVAVSVLSLGHVSSEPLVSSLESLGIRVVDGTGNFSVVLTDDYLQGGLEDFNREALASGQPWMMVKPTGSTLWLGPIFRPAQTGCWECLAQRLRTNRHVERFLQEQKKLLQPLPIPRASLPTTVQVVANLTATEIAKWLVLGHNRRLEGKVVTWNSLTMEFTEHVLVRRPQCPACGEPRYREPLEPTKVVLSSRKKEFTTDGGHRLVSPEQTNTTYAHHISSITGVVKLMQRLSSECDHLVHNYYSGPNLALKSDSMFFLGENMRSHSGGKGKSSEQARASALGEAIERYCGVFQGYEPRKQGRLKDFGDAGIHPNSCMNFSDNQYQTRDEWNAGCTKIFLRVPNPFDEDLKTDWSPVWSLTNQEFKYVPTLYCYYSYPIAPEDRFSYPDSNGNAAGNNLEEAILQGFLELIERDSVGIWWFNRLRRPAVDLSSFNEPYFADLEEMLRNLGRELTVLDITSDLGIPTFAAITRRIDQPKEDITLGFGAHLDPTIGILRALTEANQFLPIVHPAHTNGGSPYNTRDKGILDWLHIATFENQPYLVPLPCAPLKVASDYQQISSEDLRDDVNYCIEAVKKVGLETLVLDLTRPDVGLSVVKVIVPGLRHFWMRRAPGRLYDVPVKMGWLAAPLEEKELNPISVFF